MTATEVIDHRIALANGGSDTDDNCQGLCEPCHLAKTAEDFGHKQRLAIGADGWPLA